MDGQLKKTLDYTGAVLIVGQKLRGKTTAAEMQSRSVLRMQDPDHTKGYLARARHPQRAYFLILPTSPNDDFPKAAATGEHLFSDPPEVAPYEDAPDNLRVRKPEGLIPSTSLLMLMSRSCPSMLPPFRERMCSL